jgi:hypothetical protein
MALSIIAICHYAECCDLFIVFLHVVMLSVILLNVIMLNVIMLSVIMLGVIMLSVGVTYIVSILYIVLYKVVLIIL